VAPFKDRTLPTPEEANEYAIELRRLKRNGILVAPDAATTMTTLADVAGEHLARLAKVGGRRGRPYSAAGLAEARKSARPWTGEPITPRFVKGGTAEAPPAVDEHGTTFASMPLAALAVRPIEVYLERRAEQTPRAAVGEYQSLQAILRLAARRGEKFEHGLLALEPLKRRTRRRHGLEREHVGYLADCAPEHQQRLLRLGATLGNRITELLRAEDAWLDLDADTPTITIPAWACKERREKVLDLLPEEVALIREQRLVRSPNTVYGRGGTPLVFPRRHGTGWSHCGYWNDVVIPIRRKAAARWRDEHGLTDAADTPFEWVVTDDTGAPVLELDGSEKIGGFAPHDLRRTAARSLQQAGVDDKLIAARFGHVDEKLIAGTYGEDTRRQQLQDELRAIAGAGGIDARRAARRAAGAAS
jgi:integrase